MRLERAVVAELRRLAATLDRLDIAAYRACGRDPLQPIIGLGPADAPLCVMGRDPGAQEVQLALPFVGEAGQLLRAGLHAQRHPGQPYRREAGLAAGAGLFWMNTVPYKPLGNKPWSAGVRAAFQPPMARVFNRWHGVDVLTLGTEAFTWFAIGQDRAVRDEVRAFWTQGDERYRRSLDVTVRLGGTARALRLHPLPHPSRANAVWCARFPGLLAQRLRTLLPHRASPGCSRSGCARCCRTGPNRDTGSAGTASPARSPVARPAAPA